MDEVSSKVGVSGRADFVQNKLVVITPTDNPASITSLQDLAEQASRSCSRPKESR